MLDSRYQQKASAPHNRYYHNATVVRGKFILSANWMCVGSGVFFQGLTIGVKTGAINYYAPTIFKDLGLSGTTTALFAQGIYGIVKVVTCLIFVFFLADSLGRRLSFMWSGALQAFCMFFLGFVS